MFDETPLEVLKYSEAEARKEYWEDREYRSKEDADGHERKCYMWLVRGGLEHPVHSYNFRWTRSGRNVIAFLEGFSGNVIQSDGYAGYDAAVAYWNENHPDHKIELCNCNIHARRKFADSVKAQDQRQQNRQYAFTERFSMQKNNFVKNFRRIRLQKSSILSCESKKFFPFLKASMNGF